MVEEYVTVDAAPSRNCAYTGEHDIQVMFFKSWNQMGIYPNSYSNHESPKKKGHVNLKVVIFGISALLRKTK
jgi:hypothetical protein